MERGPSTPGDANPARNLSISLLLDLATIAFLAIWIFKGDFLFGHYPGPRWAIYLAATAALGNLLVLFSAASVVAQMTATQMAFFVLKCLLSLITVGVTAVGLASVLSPG